MKNVVLALVFISSLALALTVLPALGYSASSGFMLGGYMVMPLSSPGDHFTVDAYYGTAGVIKFQPGIVKTFGNRVISSTLEYRKVLERKWYGWGNSTDADSSACMDFEKRNLLFDFTATTDSPFSWGAGIDVRHSTVFNREQSILWDRVPGDVFSSTWTAGLNGGINFLFSAPVNGDLLLSTDGFFQAGDVSYAGINGKIKETLKPWSGGKISIGTMVHRQFNIADTPLPYTSGIGQNVNFRGYSDYRFTGPVWTLYQLEVENILVSLRDTRRGNSLTLAAAVFVEAGETAENISELSTAGLHKDLGCGLRFKINPSAEMRIDAAWGDEGMLIQSSFGQSF